METALCYEHKMPCPSSLHLRTSTVGCLGFLHEFTPVSLQE